MAHPYSTDGAAQVMTGRPGRVMKSSGGHIYRYSQGRFEYWHVRHRWMPCVGLPPGNFVDAPDPSKAPEPLEPKEADGLMAARGG